MTLTKAARTAVEGERSIITGQPLELDPMQRLSRADLYAGGPRVVVQVKLTSENLGYSPRRRTERQEFVLTIVDSEVLLKGLYGGFGGLWASGWHGHTPEENATYSRDKAILAKLVPMALEMQELSDSLGRKPPTEDEIHNVQITRDLHKVQRARNTIRGARMELTGAIKVEHHDIDSAWGQLMDALDEEEVRLKGEMR